MPGNETYNVILTGKALAGFELSTVKTNLATAFKLSPEAVDRYFVGKPLIVKKGADLQTAEKYKARFEEAGAECKISPVTAQPLAPSPPQNEKTAEPSPPAAAGESPAPERPRAITPPPKPVSLQYSPLACRAVSSAENGLNFNRYGTEQVPFADVLLVSVYTLPHGVKFKTKAMFFIKSQKKPLVVEAETIAYEELSIRQEDLYDSLRGFINLIFSANPGLIVDTATGDFLAGSSPSPVKRDENFWASGLGASLDDAHLFELAVTTAAQSSASGGDAAKTEPVPEYSDEEYYRFFIGPNPEKYLTHFKRFGETGDAFKPIWHWPAFFVPFFWLLYRKMYLHAIGALLLGFIPIVGLGVNIGMGLAAYFLYYKHAKSSIDQLKRYARSPDIAQTVEQEGGVNKTAVIIAAIASAVLLVIALLVFIFNFLVGKQVERAIETAPMPMPPPMTAPQGAPPGFPMPQNMEEAQRLAYDNMVMAELRQACTMAQVYFAEEGGGEPLTLEIMERYGYRRNPEVQISIDNPFPDSLQMSGSHQYGSRTMVIDRDCRFQ